MYDDQNNPFGNGYQNGSQNYGPGGYQNPYQNYNSGTGYEYDAGASPLTIRDIKAQARENLLGKYPFIIAATLLISVLQAIFTALFSNNINIYSGIVQYIVYYAAMVIICMLALFFEAGIRSMHLKASRNQPFLFKELLFAAKNYPNRFLLAALIFTGISFIWQIPMNFVINDTYYYALDWLVGLGLAEAGTFTVPEMQTFIITILITAACIALSVFLNFSFSLVFYLMIDDPQMGAKNAFATSWTYMHGERFRLFKLYISFIGMYVLGLATSGIGFLWIIPCVRQSVTVFYRDVTGH